MDIGINSALTLLHLRDINLARAEEEVGREIALRLPIAERNVATLRADARAPSNSSDQSLLVLDESAAPKPVSR